MAKISDVIAGVTTADHTEILWGLVSRADTVRLISSAPLTQKRIQWVASHGDAQQCAALVSRGASTVDADMVRTMLDRKFRKTILNAAAEAKIFSPVLVNYAIDQQALVACRAYAATTPGYRLMEDPQLAWRLLDVLHNSPNENDNYAAGTLRDNMSLVAQHLMISTDLIPSTVPWTARINVAGHFLFSSPNGLRWAEQAVQAGHGKEVLRVLDASANSYRYRNQHFSTHPPLENLRQWVADTFPPELVTEEVEEALNTLNPLPAPPHSEKEPDKELKYEDMIADLSEKEYLSSYRFRNYVRRVPVWNPVTDVLSGTLPWFYLADALKAHPAAATDVVDFLLATDVKSKDHRWWSTLRDLPNSVLADPALITHFSSVPQGTALILPVLTVKNVWAAVPASVSARGLDCVWEYLLNRASSWGDPALAWQFVLEHVETWTGTFKELADTADVMFPIDAGAGT